MKKEKKKRGLSRGSRAALAATTLLAVPLVVFPAPLAAQVEGKSRTQTTERQYPIKYGGFGMLKYEKLFLKYESPAWIAGLDEAHTIYRNSRGEMFYIDPATGDMKFVSSDYFMKYVSYKRGLMYKWIKYSDTDFTIKMGNDYVKRGVTLVGVDRAGHTVQRNPRGELFYLDPATGDMIFPK